MNFSLLPDFSYPTASHLAQVVIPRGLPVSLFKKKIERAVVSLWSNT